MNYIPLLKQDNLKVHNGRITTYYLQENLEVVTDIEYWVIHRKTGGNQSPVIRSSIDKNALLELSKKLKNGRMDSIT
jgi:hypothetical protein